MASLTQEFAELTHNFTHHHENEFTDTFKTGIQGLLAVQYSSHITLTQKWKRNGCIKALTKTDVLPFPVEKTNDGTTISITQDTNTDIDIDEDTLINGCMNSWRVDRYNPVNGDKDDSIPNFIINRHAAVFRDFQSTKKHSHEDILNACNLSKDGERALKSEFQLNLIRQTLHTIATDFDRSLLTEREFLAYHLNTRFETSDVATVIGELFDDDISEGSVRKYRSRAREKRDRAQATLTVTTQDPLVSDIRTLVPHPNSWVTETQKTGIAQVIQGEISTDRTRDQHHYWNLTDDIQLEVSPSPSDRTIKLGLYWTQSTFEQSITVDEVMEPNSVSADNITTSGALTRFSSLSGQHKATAQDIIDAVIVGLQNTEFELSREGQTPDFPALAIYGDTGDTDTGQFINFVDHIELKPRI